MSSNSDNTTTLAENKVLILYILNLIDNDITQDNLFKIITSINNINYFYFKQILTDLIDSKLVGNYTKEAEQVIKITSKGKEAYILTKDVLPGIMKLKADNIFKKEFSSIEEITTNSSISLLYIIFDSSLFWADAINLPSLLYLAMNNASFWLSSFPKLYWINNPLSFVSFMLLIYR